jgi:hypothetical protein
MEPNVCLWQIVLKGSFLADERNFLGPLMRFEFDDVRDRIVSHKNDHGPSYRPVTPSPRETLEVGIDLASPVSLD